MKDPAPTAVAGYGRPRMAVVAVVIVCMSLSVGRAAEACTTSKRDAFNCGARSHAAVQLCKGKSLQVGFNIAWPSRQRFEHALNRIATLLEVIKLNLFDLRQASVGSPMYQPFESHGAYRGSVWANVSGAKSRIRPRRRTTLFSSRRLEKKRHLLPKQFGRGNCGAVRVTVTPKIVEQRQP